MDRRDGRSHGSADGVVSDKGKWVIHEGLKDGARESRRAGVEHAGRFSGDGRTS